MLFVKKLLLTILSVITVLSLLCCTYLYTEYKDLYRIYKYNHNTISELSGQRDLLVKQIEARNEVIDKELEINISKPLSLSTNYEQFKPKKGFNLITEDAMKKIIVPLYTPDGHYFGDISYAAYEAIQYDKLQEYECISNEEMKTLHSYMNYITLNPGMSLVKLQQNSVASLVKPQHWWLTIK